MAKNRPTCYAYIMKKRQLVILVLNLVAAISVAGSAFLQWFNNTLPASVEAHQIANFIPTSVNYSNVSVAINFSVSAVLFVAAGLFVFAGLFHHRLASLFGAILAGGILVLWFVSDGFDWNAFANLANTTQFGPGVFAAATALVTGLIAAVIPGKSHKKSPES